MAWPVIAAAGINLVGGLLANRSRRKEAQKDRNFQQKMSSTSFQRGKADLEAAGMNPALAYKGGASTPGGAMAGVENVMEGAVSSAMQAKRMAAEIDLIKMQVVKTREDANMAKTGAFRNISAEVGQDFQNDLLRLQLPWAQANAKAIQRLPQAAMLQLILNSGGTQALGLVGMGAASRFLRRGSGR